MFKNNTKTLKNTLFFLFFILQNLNYAVAQQRGTDDTQAFFIKSIYSYSLSKGLAYDWLRTLCTQAGPRISGSSTAAGAVELMRQTMDTLGFDKVYLQPCSVPRWVRGAAEQVRVVGSATQGDLTLHAFALGNSVATPENGITAEVIEVQGLDEAEKLGEQLRGKIVFYNRAMDATQVSTFAAYSGAVDQRVYGPAKAAKFGALAAIVRSVGSSLDDFPHTGVTHYDEKGVEIPAVAISTNDAERLSALLKTEQKIRVFIKTNCKNMGKVPSFNVIGEIKGSRYPNEIIAVGGHLDAWDVGQGAHDDGAGVVHSIQAIYTLIKLGYKPQRTLRCVLFMNEENGLAGGEEYARVSNERKEKHIAAIESDAGGFTPRGFQTEADESVFIPEMKQILKFEDLFSPYDITIKKGGSGADISPLKSQKGLLIGFRPDSQRYFDIHHTAEDTFAKVNKRELHLGAAAISALIYLMDSNW